MDRTPRSSIVSAPCAVKPGADTEDPTMTIRKATQDDRAEWIRMRRLLWVDCTEADHVREMAEALEADSTPAFVAERPEGGLCGFLEASTRPWANGCTARPVGYVEGWFVDADVRRRGVGRALFEAAEAWARSCGYRQMASDTELTNDTSQRAHAALGY